MIQQGTRLKTRASHTIEVGELISSGGQGTTYRSKDLDARAHVVVKVFHPQFANRDTLARTEFLIAQRLASMSPVFVAPTDLIDANGIVAHISPYVDGQSASQLLYSSTPPPFQSLLTLGSTCAHAVHVLHSHKIIHGDIRDENILATINRGVIFAHFIDLDNFRTSGVPKPSHIGHELYLSPELASARASTTRVYPDIYSDRFSLGVLLHHIMLLKHPAAGRDGTPDEFAQAMYSGKWVHDPASPPVLPDPGGYPSQVLNHDIAKLFRYAFGFKKEDRPTAFQWRTELLRNLDNVHPCPACNGPCLVDATKRHCPLCYEPYPTLFLVTPTGDRMPLDNGCIRIGRRHIGGSQRVSAVHAVFRQIGPDVWVESVGRNHTYRQRGADWQKLLPRQREQVNQGDVLRLADVEVRIV